MFLFYVPALLERSLLADSRRLGEREEAKHSIGVLVAHAGERERDVAVAGGHETVLNVHRRELLEKLEQAVLEHSTVDHSNIDPIWSAYNS